MPALPAAGDAGRPQKHARRGRRLLLVYLGTMAVVSGAVALAEWAAIGDLPVGERRQVAFESPWP